jgi:Ni,Fe-hydrogenase III large subunit
VTILERCSAQNDIENSRPWPRGLVGADGWRFAAAQLSHRLWELVALWAEPTVVHCAMRDVLSGESAILSLPCTHGAYTSLAQWHPPAMRLERTIRDLFGVEPIGLPDTRPWLDHGRWGVTHPLDNSQQSTAVSSVYRFLAAEGEGLHQIGVGPVHAGIIEPGFFLFTANGETVVRLEERLGYVHKGIESLMAGRDLDSGVKLAGRTSGDSTVAYAYGFASAAEAALAIAVPRRALWLRALMAELERIANHFGDFGAICNDASFAVMHAQCGALRERVLRAANACFGHRLMRDRIVVGGVMADLHKEGHAVLRELLGEIARRLPRLAELYDKTASLQDRTVGTGVLNPALARQYACGGFIGRASGRVFDARKAIRYAPYDQLLFDVPTLSEGDVNARVWIRIREIEQSVAIVSQILNRLPEGELRADIPRHDTSREGAALVEGFRGDIFIWLRIAAGGALERCHLRDPSWFQWPLLEAAIEGNIVADFPLCNKSFNCSYSGHDL